MPILVSLVMIKKCNDKLNYTNQRESNNYSSYPNANKQSLLKKLTQKALNLYERRLDVKNFTQLALSNPENTDHVQIVEDLINNAKISDIISNKSVENLLDNEKFLRDLGL